MRMTNVAIILIICPMEGPTMKKVFLFLAAVALLGFGTQARAQDQQLTCEDYRCQFQARVDQDCPCEGNRNHGRYVSCVAHVINDLVAEGLPTNCKGKLKRCAARSVCGKQDRGFQTCTTFEYGTCTIDPISSLGSCANDPSVVCTVDTDCVVSQRCKITRHPEKCMSEGQFLDLAPTCCSNCVVVPTTLP